MPNTQFSPWPNFTQEEANAVSRVLLSNKVNYWTGTEGSEFENEFAIFAETEHAIALANGTVALDLALYGLGIGSHNGGSSNDEVIVTPRSFLASASAIVNAGARPVFADVDRNSQNITPETVAPMITINTRAILCVHLAGWPCDMDGFKKLSRNQDIKLIEDCAQAHGAKYNGRPVGGLGDVGAWSFCQDKIMTTGGEGGMLTCNDKDLWKRMWAYKDHGKSWDAVYERNHPPGFRWVHESFGTNWRLTEMQSAIGRLISKGFSDEFNDRYYLIVEGIDGKTHYADIGQVTDIDTYKTRSIVELTSKNTSPRKTDLTIAKIAATNKGLYSEELHARIDPRATIEFIRTHIRRLESLRRQNVARRFSDGSWEIPKQFLDSVSDIDKAQTKRSPITIITRSQFSLEVQAQATGATWLDRTLLATEKMPLNQAGFGAEVAKALKIRQVYLVEQGFANQTTKGIRFQQGLLDTLKTRELTKVASSIANKSGKTFQPTKTGDKIEGIYSKPVELVSGRYALIEKSKQFTLVPWRSVLENVRGKSVSGIMSKGGGISWDIGRKKGMGIS